MSIQASEISAILKDQIKNFGKEAVTILVILNFFHSNFLDIFIQTISKSCFSFQFDEFF